MERLAISVLSPVGGMKGNHLGAQGCELIVSAQINPIAKSLLGDDYVTQ
jgi:hypothetical protein